MLMNTGLNVLKLFRRAVLTLRKTGFTAFILASVWALAGCAGTGGNGGGSSQEGSRNSEQSVASPSEAPVASKRFQESGELDKLLDAKPIALAAVKPASQAVATGSGSAKTTEPVSKGRGNFRLQVGAESDVDAAQAKKQEYERTLGGNVDVVFDAPYYKLRWGYFDSKQDAEDKVLELSDLKIQMFVVKQ